MSSFLRLASLSAFWLAFCFTAPQVPLMAESMNNGLGPSVSSQSAGLPLSSLSAELLTTLDDLRRSYPKLLEESESLKNQVAELSWQLTALSAESEIWEAESKRLTDSLNSLIAQFEDYRSVSQSRAMLDGQAVNEARGALPWAWAGGIAIGFAIGWSASTLLQ